MINVFRSGNPGTYDDPAFIKLFWSRVAQGLGCWLWTLRPRRHGYGAMRVNLKDVTCQRIAWVLTYGPIPPGICVCHSCDTPLCCRPDHLFLGTNLDNMRDRKEKGRNTLMQGVNNAGHKLTESQVYAIRYLHASRKFKNNKLAEMFGVNRRTIYRIQKRIHWKNLDAT